MTDAVLFLPGSYECPGAEWELIEVDVLAGIGYCQTCGERFELNADGGGELHYLELAPDPASGQLVWSVIRGSLRPPLTEPGTLRLDR